MEPIILASLSPRRREYLRLMGLPFTSIPPAAEEVVDSGKEPRAMAEELAVKKVNSVVETLTVRERKTAWVCGADTLISLWGKVFGKPENRDDARRMLESFSGRTHEVISALALYSGRAGKTDCRSVVSVVTFATLSPGEIAWYLDTGEWRDAAGAYKIQGLASCFIASINGSYSSVVGLPLREFYVMLRDNKYPFGG